jgi:hypothetical protein
MAQNEKRRKPTAGSSQLRANFFAVEGVAPFETLEPSEIVI